MVHNSLKHKRCRNVENENIDNGKTIDVAALVISAESYFFRCLTDINEWTQRTKPF